MFMNRLIFVFGLFLAVISTVNVSASEFTPDNNLFENTQSNNLIDMAYSQIDNFSSKKFAIFQIEQNYYLVSSDDVVINSSNIVFNNSTIISAIRNSSGYNSYFDYSTFQEGSTTVNLSYVIISNVPTSKSVYTTRFNDYKFYQDLTNICIFVLGILFALFVTKERRF